MTDPAKKTFSHGNQGFGAHTDAATDQAGSSGALSRQKTEDAVGAAFGPFTKPQDVKPPPLPPEAKPPAPKVGSPAAAGEGSALAPGASTSTPDSAAAQLRKEDTMRTEQQASAKSQSLPPMESGNQYSDKLASNQTTEQKLAQQSGAASNSDKAQATPHTESQQVKQPEKADLSVGGSAPERGGQQPAEKNQTKEVAGMAAGTISDTKPAPSTANNPRIEMPESRDLQSSKSPSSELQRNETVRRENAGQAERSQQADKPRVEANEAVQAKRGESSKGDQSSDRSTAQVRPEITNKAGEVGQGPGRLPEATAKVGEIPPASKDGKPEGVPPKVPDGKIVDQSTILGNALETDPSTRKGLPPIKETGAVGGGGTNIGGREVSDVTSKIGGEKLQITPEPGKPIGDLLVSGRRQEPMEPFRITLQPFGDRTLTLDLTDRSVRRQILDTAENLQTGKRQGQTEQLSTLFDSLSKLPRSILEQITKTLSAEFRTDKPIINEAATTMKLAELMKELQAKPSKTDEPKTVLGKVANLYDSAINFARQMFGVVDSRMAQVAKLELPPLLSDKQEFKEEPLAKRVEVTQGTIDAIFNKMLKSAAKGDRTDEVDADPEPANTFNTDKEDNRRFRYVTKLHDSLESIASAKLGDSKLSSLLYQINKALIPNKMADGKLAPDVTPDLVLYLPSPVDIAQYNKIVQAIDKEI